MGTATSYIYRNITILICKGIYVSTYIVMDIVHNDCVRNGLGGALPTMIHDDDVLIAIIIYIYIYVVACIV